MARVDRSLRGSLLHWRSLVSHPSLVVEGARFVLQTNPLRSWFFLDLLHQDYLARGGWHWPSRNYYEFGVGWGGTLTNYIKALNTFCRVKKKDISQYHIFGFDSFEGLPEKVDKRDDDPTWNKGYFAHSLEEIEEKVRKEIDLTKGNVRFIKGFFNETLTPELRDSLSSEPPSIVTVDVDYYSSTKTVLEWLCPILPSGCLFYFDDIWGFYGNPTMGVRAAVEDFNKSNQGWLTLYTELGPSSMIGKTFIYAKNET